MFNVAVILDHVASYARRFQLHSTNQGSARHGHGAAGHGLETLEDRRMLSATTALTPSLNHYTAPAVLLATADVAAPIVEQVTGNGVVIAAGDAAPQRSDFTDFGPMDVSTGTSTRTFSITNSGTDSLTFTGATPVTVTGANASDFVVELQPSGAIDSAGSAGFRIRFNPSGAGVRTATVNIASNDTANPIYSFAISGTGLNMTTAADGLQTFITAAGTGTLVTQPGHHLNVSYTGTLLDGTVFDATSLHGGTPLALTLGTGQVIAGWDEGLVGMKVGEKRTLIIPSALAYGAAGQGNIPPNAILIFEVELISVDGPTLAISGNNMNIPAGDTTPSSADGTDFGDVAIGAGTTHTFVITNGTAGSLSLTGNPGVAISGAGASQFLLTQPTINTAHTALSFTVQYRPTLPGSATATLTIPSNDPITPTFTFKIHGQAPAELSGVYAATLNIPANVGAGDKFTVPVTITNNGMAAAKGTINLLVKASADSTFDAGASDVAVGTLTTSVNIPVHGSVTVNVPVTIPAAATLATGTYHLLTMIQIPVGSNVADSDLTNNLVSQTAAAVDAMITVVPAAPDLTVQLGAAGPVAPTYVPGDRITIPVTLTNIGIRAAVGTSAAPIVVQIRGSSDSTFDSGSDVLLTTVNITSSIAAGTSVTVPATFTLPATVAPGSYFAVAKADTTGVVSELDETNNTAATAAAVTVAWQFGAIAGRTGSVPLTFNDINGTKVTLKLTGPGTGTLMAVDGSPGEFDIALTGTTSASTFTITTAKPTTAGDDGRFTLRNLTVGNTGDANDHTALGTLAARTTDLANGGDVTIMGPIKTLRLGNVADDHAITIGAPASVPAGTSPPAATITLGAVQDASITSAIRIAALTAIRWLDAGGAADVIAAPSLGTLKITGAKASGAVAAIAGDFGANLNLTGPGATTTGPLLGATTIANQITGGTWTIAGSATSVSAKSVDAGWQANFTGATGNLGTLTLSDANATSDLEILANAIGTMKVLGNLTGSQITLAQAVSVAKLALGTFTVSQTMTNSQIRSAGNIGTVTVGTLDHSLVFAGVEFSVMGRPAAPGDFVNVDPALLPRIATFRVTGLSAAPTAAAFIDSDVAAGIIGTISLPTRTTAIGDPDNSSPFGFAVRTAGAKYTGPVSSGNYVSGADALV